MIHSIIKIILIERERTLYIDLMDIILSCFEMHIDKDTAKLCIY